MHDVIELKNIFKGYSVHDSFVLENVSLKVGKSVVTALLGPSGSGKSTLLHIAGLLDSPTDGNIIFENRKIEELSDDEKTHLRLHKIGFVYQYHHLLQEFSSLENVMLPMLVAGADRKLSKEKAEHLLEILGLKEKINMFPSELSGGQKQRALASEGCFLHFVNLQAKEDSLPRPTGGNLNLLPHREHRHPPVRFTGQTSIDSANITVQTTS